MPRVRPRTSWLPFADLSQMPSCMRWVFSGSRRARAMISAMTSSTTLRVLEYGALKTAMPRSAAVSRSTWLVPMQKQPMASRSGALSRARLVIVVLERMPSRCTPGSTAASSSSWREPVRSSTSKPRASRTSTASGWMFSSSRAFTVNQPKCGRRGRRFVDRAWDGTDPAGRHTEGGIEGTIRMTSRRRSGSGGQVLRVDDPVRVPLLGEEPLPVLGELGVHGVAGDDRVEVRGLALGLRAEQPAQPLRLLLAGAERAGHLDRHLGRGQVDREVRDLGDDQQLDLAGAERVEEPLPLVDR